MIHKVIEAAPKLPAWKPVHRVRVERGEKMYVNGNHHACRQTGTIWYRHDKVIIRFGCGKEQILEGMIQTKERKPRGIGSRLGVRTEVSTAFGGWSVPGANVDWLLKMNNINLDPDEDESIVLIQK